MHNNVVDYTNVFQIDIPIFRFNILLEYFQPSVKFKNNLMVFYDYSLLNNIANSKNKNIFIFEF